MLANLTRPSLPRSESFLILSIRGSLLALRLLLVLYIGKYLGLQALGLYGLASGAVAFTPIMVSMGMAHLIMRDTVSQSSDERATSLVHYWLYIASIYTILVLIFLPIIYIYKLDNIFILFSFICILEHFGNDFFHLFINLSRPVLGNITAFLRGGLWIILYIPAASLWSPFRSMEGLVVLWLLGDLLAIAVAAWSVRQWPWRGAFQRRPMLGGFRLALRRSRLLFVSDLTHLAAQYLDRYVVSYFLGLETAGVYFFFWTIGNAVNTLVTLSFIQVQRPKLIMAHINDVKNGTGEYVKSASSFLRENVIITLAFTVGIGIAFNVLSPYLHKLEILPYMDAFWLIMVASGVRTLADFGAMAQFAAGRDMAMTASNIASLLLFILISITLTPPLGIYGVAFAVLGAFAIVGAWRFWQLRLLSIFSLAS